MREIVEFGQSPLAWSLKVVWTSINATRLALLV